MLNGGLQQGENRVEDGTANTEGNHADCADGKGKLGVAITVESGQRVVALADIHGLDNLQIIEE